MRVVIDTNILFAGLSYTSFYFPIIRGIYDQKFEFLVSTSVLLEYKEILQKEYPEEMMTYFLDFLENSENVIFVNPTFRFMLPFEDEDDQKFVDCAICGNADFLITNDRHFNILKTIEFPRLKIIKADEFIQMFLK